MSILSSLLVGFFSLAVNASGPHAGEEPFVLKPQRPRDVKELQELRILKKLGDHPSIQYYSETPWGTRLNAVGALDSNHLTPEQRVSLQMIADHDPHPIVADEARVALWGRETISMRARADRAVLAKIGDLKSIQYKWEAPAYERVVALEKLQAPFSETQRRDLEKVGNDDPDEMVRTIALDKLAGKPSYDEAELVAEGERVRNIGAIPELNYHPSDIWYHRLEAVKIWSGHGLSQNAIKGLRDIAAKETDLRIRDAANQILKRHAEIEKKN